MTVQAVNDKRVWIKAERLKEAMDKVGVSVDALAKKAMVSTQVIKDALAGKYETVYIQASTRYHIAKALDTTMAYLMDKPEVKVTGNVLICSRGKNGRRCEVISAEEFNSRLGK